MTAVSLNTLNTLNPDYLLYQYEQLHFEVLGGIKLDVLNSMRATVKVKHFNAEQRHTLDLYNHNALQRFLKTTAEQLEVGIQYIQKATGALINELEVYRLQEIQRTKDKVQPTKILTEAEITEAKAFLQTTTSPGVYPEPVEGGRAGEGLLHATNELLGKSGIIGEDVNRIIMYLIFTTRKLSNPLHIISLASSGTGKSYLQEKVSQCIPEEDKKEITALSPNSFYYQGQLDLKHKLILLEDLTGAESSMYPIRELQSKKYIIKEVSHKNGKGDTVTITKKVEGPVCIAACTTDEQIYEDNANRSFLIYLDDSKEQDERIMDYQRAEAAGHIDHSEQHKAKQLLQNVQRVLKPVKIINPYAMHLNIPNEIFKKRRTNAHYLQFIEAITFYKQYQKQEQVNEETGELYIETTIEDIQEANNLIKHILLRKSDELNGATRHYLELLKEYLKQEQKIEFKTKDVRQHYRLNPNSQKTYMMHLVQHGYIRKNSGDQKKGFAYSITNVNEYKALEEQIETILLQSMAKACHPELLPERSRRGREAVKQLKAVEQPTQPLKPRPAKEKSK